MGIAYIRFAADEPQLFQLIFMNEPERAIHQFSEFLPIKDYSYEKMICPFKRNMDFQDSYQSNFISIYLFIHMELPVWLLQESIAFHPQN